MSDPSSPPATFVKEVHVRKVGDYETVYVTIPQPIVALMRLANGQKVRVTIEAEEGA